MLPDALELEDCAETETRLGEGPVWDGVREVLWFVDILDQTVLSWDPAAAHLRRYPMPDLVTSIGLTSDERLLVSLRKTVCFFTPATGVFEHLATPEGEDVPNRLNDGKVGPDGAFWVGSMHATRPTRPTGALFRISPDGDCRRVIADIHVSNGLAWSPDNRTMYHADSRATFIKAWDFDPCTGNIANGRILATPTLEEGLPDGAAVDTDGNYWSAGVTAGCIHIFDPEGRRLRTLAAPMEAPTMPCFGGADGRTLFITGLTREGDGRTARGRLMSCRVNASGVPVARFGCPL
ncbi:SMP-30/gluconolactonase/LRE family protein [Mesorhizobium sp. ASY16-5R]|uniref:SMP-30/gluconolactonase/LRE family protein n=1 Tax=Mesorhizobium sp. ASY16-5R TaxID=3445772 RepID=UPI003FA0EAC0